MIFKADRNLLETVYRKIFNDGLVEVVNEERNTVPVTEVQFLDMAIHRRPQPGTVGFMLTHNGMAEIDRLLKKMYAAYTSLGNPVSFGEFLHRQVLPYLPPGTPGMTALVNLRMHEECVERFQEALLEVHQDETVH